MNVCFRYIKGRLTFSVANGVVDELNKALTAKYEVFSQPRSARSEAAKKRLLRYKEQETKDTAGEIALIHKRLFLPVLERSQMVSISKYRGTTWYQTLKVS